MNIGEILEHRFELKAILGEGGMGQVFQAWDRELERFVAIKTLLSQFLSDPAAVDDMKREVRTSQQLAHPRIVTVFDYRVHERTPYIVMEYVEGETLNYFVYRQPGHRLGEAGFRPMALAILDAAGYAHSKRVIHRDLKPANIMVRPDGELKLMDFGIAATIKATYTRLTGNSSGLTIQYSSPEQIRGENPAPAMDIYSLGCIFYEMLSGEPPFTRGDVLHQQLTKPAAPIAGVTGRLNEAVLMRLKKGPGQRAAPVGRIRQLLVDGQTVKIARPAPAEVTAPGPRPGAGWRSPSTGMEFVWIPPGGIRDGRGGRGGLFRRKAGAPGADHQRVLAGEISGDARAMGRGDGEQPEPVQG